MENFIKVTPMLHNVTTTAVTVFLFDNFDDVDKPKLQLDYHKTYHSKRPTRNPEIRDRFFYIDGSDSKDNFKQINAIDELIRIHDLRAVNFIILEKGEQPLNKECKDKFKGLMIKWNNHFKRNSFSGFLTTRITTQNFQATLIDGKVRGINNFTAGLSITS